MDPSFAVSLASAILALVIAFETFRAFGYARKAYLLNFSGGFLLLGLSYAILIPLAFGAKMPMVFSDADDIVNYPVFAFMQTFGYILIALAYSQTGRVKEILTGLISLLSLLIVLLAIPALALPDSFDVFLYFLNTVLLGYVLYHMLKVTPPKDLVFVGFVLLALHEYTALIGSVDETAGFSDEASFLLAELLRLSALCVLFVSFLVARRGVRNREVIQGVESA